METQSNNHNPFEHAPIIFSYTRQQAIDDGVLIDLTSWAKETGFRVGVACTYATWTQHIEPPKGTEDMGQSVRGRAHDMLWLLYLNIQNAPLDLSETRFEVVFLNNELEQETVTLKAVCGPDDLGEPAITIMLPHED